jgi:hypothetical protein
MRDAAGVRVTTPIAALDAAERLGFPLHAIAVRSAASAIRVATVQELAAAAAGAIAREGAAWIERVAEPAAPVSGADR